MDKGIGISREDQPKIFNIFKEDSNLLEKTTGLGLMISKEIVSQYNGKISFESVFKVGSSFSYFMDLEEAETLPIFGDQRNEKPEISYASE